MGEDVVMTRPTLRAGERGQILVFTAVSLVALMGIAALSIDASHLYDRRNRLYAAADAAAKSAAFAMYRRPSSDLYAFASHELAVMGLTPVTCGSTGGASLCVYSPPVSGPFTSSPGYVEVVVSEQSTATFFGRILGWMSANPGARAVAGISNSNACLIVNQDMSLGNTCPPGNPTFDLNGCGAEVGRNLSGTNPNACIGGTPTPQVDVTGTCSGTCGGMGALHVGAPPPIDPLANLPLFTNPYPPASCTAGVGPILDPGCYTSIANSVTTLRSGEYYITGTVNIDNLSSEGGGATASNSYGVFLYLAGGVSRLHAANNKTLSIKAMSNPGTYSGNTYTGVAIFQERGNISNFDTGNNFTLAVNGAIYMPSADVIFPNSLDFVQTGCTLFIAKSLRIENGHGSMNNSGCAASFGGSAFLSVQVSE